jgi:hypothetical protein
LKTILFIALSLCACIVLADDTTTQAATAAASSGTATTISGFFRKALGFIDHGLYEIIGNVLKFFIAAVALFQLELKMAALELAAESADKILSAFNISGSIQSTLDNLDPQMSSIITFFKIPEAINLLLSAHLTRFIMSNF